jgi:uncharacterized protein YacL
MLPVEAALKQRALLLKVVRVTFLILIVTFTMLAFLQRMNDPLSEGLAVRWWLPLVVAFMLFGAALAADILTPNKKISTILGVMVGVIAGLLATLALGFLIDLLVESWVQNKDAVDALKPAVNSVKILIGITLCYLGVTTVIQTQDDFRLVIPYVEFAKQIRGTRPMLIDTSALIDGRLVDVAATGFLQAPLVIPRFVVQELQSLADSSDGLKRAKGRRGLDVITKLQRAPRLDVTVDESPVPGVAVDQMLVEVARTMPALIVTTDSGLARVAGIHNVPVLNLHELSNAMKSALVPGEHVTVRLIKPGEQAGQAVGYLPDGTMIVAEDGAARLGQDTDLIVASSLQTSGGRLIFARLANTQSSSASEAQAQTQSQTPSFQPPIAAPSEMAPTTESAPSTEVAAPNEPSAADARGGPFPPVRPRMFKPGSPRNPRR